MRKKICILCFTLIRRDARVLRQIKYLIGHYDLTVIGYGPRPEQWENDSRLDWHDLSAIQTTEQNQPVQTETSAQIWLRWYKKSVHLARSGQWTEFMNKMKAVLRPRIINSLRQFGLVAPGLYEKWYWSVPDFQKAYAAAIEEKYDAFYANDWNTLPIAAAAAKAQGARLVFDAHEYAPLEYSTLSWRLKMAPLIVHILRKYGKDVDAALTVAPKIAERYAIKFDFAPEVLYNSPERVAIPRRAVDPETIHIVHHGGAVRIRRLEEIVKTVGLCDPRFHLHFFLTGNDEEYKGSLKKLGERLAEGRVHFHDPVAPDQITNRIAVYDIGFNYTNPDNFNYILSLPNKFFDAIIAGLSIFTGPSPEMASICRQYGLGLVASSFKPKDMAKSLNRLTAEDIEQMKRAAVVASEILCAQKEMQKLVGIFQRLLGKG